MARRFFWLWCCGPSENDPPTSVARVKHSKEAIPTTIDYVLEGTSEAIKVLQSASIIIGTVPGAQPVLDLALALIDTCQDLTEIEGKVAELKMHIEKVMLVMVAGITKKEHTNLPEDLINDIKKLGSDLESIKEDLDKIASQSRFLVALFRTANRSRIDRCLQLLKNSLVHWEVARNISQGIIMDDIQQGIHIMQDELQNMQKSVGLLNRRVHTAKHASSRQMPRKPANFCGRDEFVEDIVRTLVSTSTGQQPSRICIHGPGGMGKTSAAVAAMEHPDILKKFSQNDRFWVPCVSATSSDTLLHILYSNLRISRDTGDYLADIMAELQSSTSPRLMLLDNFETPWDPIQGTREEVKDILHQLATLSQLSILVTMRTNIPPSEQIQWVDMPIGVVRPEISAAIYCSVHPCAKGKPKLAELLDELGHMPFAITVVATLGNESKSMPEVLLKDWRKQGPSILSPDDSAEDSISRSINLSMNSKTIVKNVPARTLLATLALLPAGTTHQHLDWWAPGLKDKKTAAISSLSNVALVVDTERGNDVSISVLPVVQSFMQQRDRISSAVREAVRDACYAIVLKHKSSPGDANFKDDLMFLSSEEVNIQPILLEATRDVGAMGSNIEKCLEVLIAFSWYQHWTRPRTEVIEHALRLARKAKLDACVAECLFCLGSTLFRLDMYKDATEHLTEAQEYFQKLSNIVRASECAFELVTVYSSYLHDRSRAQTALSSVSEDDMRADQYVEARGKLMSGKYLYYAKSQPSEVLRDLTDARTIFEEINKPVDAAFCFHEIARVLGTMRKFPEAVEAVNFSLAIYEKFGPENRLVDTLLVKSYLLLSTYAPFEQVLPILERTLRRGQTLGGPLTIAQVLEFFGELYAREGKVSSALEYYKAAEAEYGTISQRRDVYRCRENYNRLTLAEKDTEVNIDRLSQYLLG